MLKLTNFVDEQCSYGYMTLCKSCTKIAPRHVKVNEPLTSLMAGSKCEICKRPGVVTMPTKCPQRKGFSLMEEGTDNVWCSNCDWPYHGDQQW
jgi:hypothetical protein